MSVTKMKLKTSSCTAGPARRGLRSKGAERSWCVRGQCRHAAMQAACTACRSSSLHCLLRVQNSLHARIGLESDGVRFNDARPGRARNGHIPKYLQAIMVMVASAPWHRTPHRLIGTGSTFQRSPCTRSSQGLSQTTVDPWARWSSYCSPPGLEAPFPEGQASSTIAGKHASAGPASSRTTNAAEQHHSPYLEGARNVQNRDGWQCQARAAPYPQTPASLHASVMLRHPLPAPPWPQSRSKAN